MIRRYTMLLFAVVSLFGAAPIFAAICQPLNGPGPLGAAAYECIQSGPTSSYNFTFYGPNQDSMCYLFPPNGLYKSLGVYGYGNGEWSFTAPNPAPPNSPQAYFSIKIILDLNNTHNHNTNRLGVLVYIDNSTVENLGTIDGSGGDICSGTYTFNVYRPGWAGRDLRLSLVSLFQDNDANSKVGSVSFTTYDRQVW